MIRNKVPSGPDANSFSEVYSWEHVVKDAENHLVRSEEYERAQRIIQPYWKRCAKFIGNILIAGGAAVNCMPEPFGYIINDTDQQQG